MKKEALTLEEKDKDKEENQAAEGDKPADELTAGGDKDEKQAAEDSKSADKKSVGGNIRAFRKQQGMTQEKLASEIETDVSNKTGVPAFASLSLRARG